MGRPKVTPDMRIEWWPIDKPIDYPKNARKWSANAIGKVATSIGAFGWRQPIVVDRDGVICIGHLRRRAGKEAGKDTCPVHVAAELSPAQIRQLRLLDNRSHEESEWDMEKLVEEMKELAAMDLDLSLTGFDDAEFVAFMTGLNGDAKADANKTLAERFGVPPFSVLDARQGYWQDRKAAWLALGIQSELGRGGAPGGSPRPAAQLTASGVTMRGDGRGRPIEAL